MMGFRALPTGFLLIMPHMEPASYVLRVLLATALLTELNHLYRRAKLTTWASW